MADRRPTSPEFPIFIDQAGFILTIHCGGHLSVSNI
jgi:hypothetical protein